MHIKLFIGFFLLGLLPAAIRRGPVSLRRNGGGMIRSQRGSNIDSL